MSAPNTNVEKQTRRHRPVLIGFAVVAAFVVIIFLVNLLFVTDPDDTLVDDNPVLLEPTVEGD